MPVNWDNLDFDQIAEDSAETTDQKLASRISSLTRMTDAEINELFPEPADVKKLAELMKVVKSSCDRNEKINELVSKSEQFAHITLKLLERFV